MSLPNPVAPLNALVEQTLTVADLVSTSLWTIDPDEKTADAAASLAARDFDVAGVAAEPITHYVTREALSSARGRTLRAAHPILASDCIEKSLPLADLFERLAVTHYVFVLDNDHVRWVITRADLQAPAVSVVVLAYLVVIEAGLRPLVLYEYGDSWLDVMPKARRTKAEQLFAQKKLHNVAIGLEDCLYFADWLNLAARSEPLRLRLGFTSRRAFDDTTRVFDVLRNDLAHGGTILDAAEADPERALDRVGRVRSFATRVWDEVARHSEMWDVYASTVLQVRGARAPIAGPRAQAQLPASAPLHVITAWNPGSIRRSIIANREANDELAQLLTRHGHRPTAVRGASPDGKWQEESLLVSGLRRERAAEIGEMFGQVAIFELTVDELRVIRCADGAMMRVRKRRGTG